MMGHAEVKKERKGERMFDELVLYHIPFVSYVLL